MSLPKWPIVDLGVTKTPLPSARFNTPAYSVAEPTETIVERSVLGFGTPTHEIGDVIERHGRQVVVTKASGPIMERGEFVEEIEYELPR